MSEIRVEEQERVVEVLDESAIVSASAGSGKTSVMIRKIIKAVTEQNVDISNILALTYTNAAAAEMKQRLTVSFNKFVEGATDEKKINFIAEQIDKLSTADISTFHSFYERIVKKYFYILQINPSFEILSEEEFTVLKNKAFEQAIDEFKKNNFEEYLIISDILGKKRSDKEIKERILKLDEFLSSQFDHDAWLNDVAISLYKDKKKTYNLLADEIKLNINDQLSKLKELLNECSRCDELALVEYLNTRISIFNSLKNLSFKDLHLQLTENFRLPQLRNSSKINNQELFNKVKETKEEFADFVTNYKEEDLGSIDIIEKSFKTCQKNLVQIIELYKNYKAILFLMEKEKNAYDFACLENLCYEILLNGEIQKIVKKQYELVFVDEFQDINPIQYEILKLITRENNKLFVGDPKQSIYAFRQSDVDIFTYIFGRFNESKDAKALPLNCNFRTNKKILDFNNQIFNTLMTESSSDINYEKDAQFNALSKNDCDNNAVVISMIKNEKETEKEDQKGIYNIFEDIPEKKEIALEARVISAQIANIIKKEMIYEGENKTPRKINFKDIAILLRNRSETLDELVKAFKKYNIPFIVNDKFDLLNSKEVKLLISLLNVCFNVHDDLNLAPVLASKFGNLTLDELAEIRKAHKEEEFFHTCCEKYSQESNDNISEKLRMFYSFVNNFKLEIQLKGACVALDRAMKTSGLYEIILLRKNGVGRLEKIAQFLEYILQSEYNFDLFSLLQFIQAEQKMEIPSVNKCNIDAVNITTIHSSKGLEFPIVFLADAGRDLNKTKHEVGELKINKRLGLAIKNYSQEDRKIYNSIFEKIIKVNEKRKGLAENLRLLYVALTRAKNKLFISGNVNKEIVKINKNTNLLNIKSSYINYILGAFDKDTINDINLNLIEKKEFEKASVLFNVIGEENFVYDEKIDQELPVKDIQNLYAGLKNIDYEYPHKKDIYLAQKTSVTQVALEDNGFESQTSQPQNFLTTEHLNIENTNVNKGILIHSILENVDFNNKDLSKEITRAINDLGVGEFDKKNLADIVLKNIIAINKILPKTNITYKEKQFILNASIQELYGQGDRQKLLIQGKVDLLSFGEKNIIIDYKLTSIKDEEKLKDKYSKQLLAYAFAVKEAIGQKVDYIYILSLLEGKLIQLK